MTERNSLHCGDCLEIMRQMPNDSVDLVFGSPPYEDCRTYGIDFNLKGQDWVDWMAQVFIAADRICKGLVAFVVDGKTKQYKWSCTPALLVADLHRAGLNVRKPPIYHRVGIPGSGGPDWLRSDYEWIVSTSRKGKLPWSDNTACGHEPRWPVGGALSHRTKGGSRITKPRGRDGKLLEQGYRPPKLVNPGNTLNVTKIGGLLGNAGQKDEATPSHGGRSGKVNPDGTITRKNGSIYTGPKVPNPGSLIHCNAGGGVMGSRLAHENEAPFPEKLAEFFIKSFCPPDGIVLDPFCGSGTVPAVAKKNGRNYIGIDIRPSQIELTLRRLAE